MTPEQAASSPAKKRSRVFPFFLGLCLLLIVAGGVWYFVMVKPTQQATRTALDKVEDFFGGLFGNKATVIHSGDSSVLRVEDIGEMALMEFELKVAKDMKHEQVALHVLTSKKELRMQGKFRVKVGYDVSEGLTVTYDEAGRAVIAGLVGPKVLSAEMVSVKTMEDSSGLWNKVDQSDRDALTNQLRLQAIRDVKEGGMLEQLDSLMRANLKALLGVDDFVIEPLQSETLKRS